MHFIKTIVSLFALSSVAVARIGDADLEGRDVAEVAHEEYLVARDEYIEKRELFRRVSFLTPYHLSPASLTLHLAGWQRYLQSF